MKNRYSIILCLLISGCSNEEGLKVLIAESELQAYAIPEGKESFTILKGEVCAAGKKKVMKSFRYVEVVCPNKGYAWVITGDHYKIENKQNNE